MIDDHIHCHNCYRAISRFNNSLEEVEVPMTGIVMPIQTPEGIGFGIKPVPICPACLETIMMEQSKATNRLVLPPTLKVTKQ